MNYYNYGTSEEEPEWQEITHDETTMGSKYKTYKNKHGDIKTVIPNPDAGGNDFIFISYAISQTDGTILG